MKCSFELERALYRDDGTEEGHEREEESLPAGRLDRLNIADALA